MSVIENKSEIKTIPYDNRHNIFDAVCVVITMEQIKAEPEQCLRYKTVKAIKQKSAHMSEQLSRINKTRHHQRLQGHNCSVFT